MTYHVVFDISQRIVDALFVVPVVIGLIYVLAIAARTKWRLFLPRSSMALLTVASLLWAAFQVHYIGGVAGLIFGGVPAVAMLWGVSYIWVEGTDFKVETSIVSIRAGTLGVLVAFLVLCLLAVFALHVSPSFALEQKLAAGQASVVLGPVEHHTNYNWGTECFTVSGRRFCYDNSFYSVGFHQTHSNGGPISDGLQVRVTYIGDDIVRLEIADGQ